MLLTDKFLKVLGPQTLCQRRMRSKKPSFHLVFSFTGFTNLLLGQKEASKAKSAKRDNHTPGKKHEEKS
jgi:hypothetical protein